MTMSDTNGMTIKGKDLAEAIARREHPAPIQLPAELSQEIHALRQQVFALENRLQGLLRGFIYAHPDVDGAKQYELSADCQFLNEKP